VKAKTMKPGKVQKIIKPIDPAEPEKAEISVHGADDLYREIRIENTLQDSKGETVALKPGAEVEVVVEADQSAVEPKKKSGDHKDHHHHHRKDREKES
jgi:predicted DNA-binding antitoxin AbrB/MazE fold protein